MESKIDATHFALWTCLVHKRRPFFASNGCHGTWVGRQQFGSAISVQIAVLQQQRIANVPFSTCLKTPLEDSLKQGERWTAMRFVDARERLRSLKKFANVK